MTGEGNLDVFLTPGLLIIGPSAGYHWISFLGLPPNKWGFLKRGYPKSGNIIRPFYTMYFFIVEAMVLGRVDSFFETTKSTGVYSGFDITRMILQVTPFRATSHVAGTPGAGGDMCRWVEHVEWKRIGCRHPKFWRKMRFLNAQKNQHEDWHLSNTIMRICLCNVAIPRCTSLQYVRKWTEIETI